MIESFLELIGRKRAIVPFVNLFEYKLNLLNPSLRVAYNCKGLLRLIDSWLEKITLT